MLYRLCTYAQAPAPTHSRVILDESNFCDSLRHVVLEEARRQIQQFCWDHPEFRPYHSDEWEWLAEPLDPGFKGDTLVIVAQPIPACKRFR